MNPLRLKSPLALARTLLLAGTAVAVAGTATAQSTSALTLDPKGAVKARIGYFPVQIKLTDEKPANVTKEPTYRAKPKYGVVQRAILLLPSMSQPMPMPRFTSTRTTTATSLMTVTEPGARSERRDA